MNNTEENLDYLQMPDPILEGYPIEQQLQFQQQNQYFTDYNQNFPYIEDPNQIQYQVMTDQMGNPFQQHQNQFIYYGGQQMGNNFIHNNVNQFYNNQQIIPNEPLFNELGDQFEQPQIINYQYPPQQQEQLLDQQQQNIVPNNQQYQVIYYDQQFYQQQQEQQQSVPQDQLFEQIQEAQKEIKEEHVLELRNSDELQKNEEESIEKSLRKSNTQMQTIQITKHTFNTSIDKYQNLNDEEDETKNLIRNYGTRLMKDIECSKENREENKWITRILKEYINKHKILNGDDFMNEFFDIYSVFEFSSIYKVRQEWTVEQGGQNSHFKNAFREVCFHFFSKMPLNYIYKVSNKVTKKNQRLTHIKYIATFLKGLIYPLRFQKFKISDKEKQLYQNFHHTTS